MLEFGEFRSLACDFRPSGTGTKLATGAVVPQGAAMWSWIFCYVTGHDYSVSCDGGAMFLRCMCCGRRSNGWVVHDDDHAHAHGSRV